MSDAPEIVCTDQAAAAIGPYSQAVIHHGLVFTSGQIGIDPTTGRMVEGGVEAEARQVFANLTAILRAAGSDLRCALKVTVYLQNLEDFKALNQLYSKAFGEARPARATVQVARLPMDALVEMDVVAHVDT